MRNKVEGEIKQWVKAQECILRAGKQNLMLLLQQYIYIYIKSIALCQILIAAVLQLRLLYCELTLLRISRWLYTLSSTGEVGCWDYNYTFALLYCFALLLVYTMQDTCYLHYSTSSLYLLMKYYYSTRTVFVPTSHGTLNYS